MEDVLFRNLTVPRQTPAAAGWLLTKVLGLAFPLANAAPKDDRHRSCRGDVAPSHVRRSFLGESGLARLVGGISN
jgi:hypothetical protein